MLNILTLFFLCPKWYQTQYDILNVCVQVLIIQSYIIWFSWSFVLPIYYLLWIGSSLLLRIPCHVICCLTSISDSAVTNYRCGMLPQLTLNCWFFSNHIAILFLSQDIGARNGNFCRYVTFSKIVSVFRISSIERCLYFCFLWNTSTKVRVRGGQGVMKDKFMRFVLYEYMWFLQGNGCDNLGAWTRRCYALGTFKRVLFRIWFMWVGLYHLHDAI